MSTFTSKARNWAEADSSDDEGPTPAVETANATISAVSETTQIAAAANNDDSSSESESESEDDVKQTEVVEAAPSQKSKKNKKPVKKAPLSKEEQEAKRQKELKKLDAAFAAFGVKLPAADSQPVVAPVAAEEQSVKDSNNDSKKKKPKKKPAKKAAAPEPEEAPAAATGLVDIAEVLKAKQATKAKVKDSKQEAIALALKAAEENKKSKKRVKANDSEFAY